MLRKGLVSSELDKALARSSFGCIFAICRNIFFQVNNNVQIFSFEECLLHRYKSSSIQSLAGAYVSHVSHRNGTCSCLTLAAGNEKAPHYLHSVPILKYLKCNVREKMAIQSYGNHIKILTSPGVTSRKEHYKCLRSRRASYHL